MKTKLIRSLVLGLTAFALVSCQAPSSTPTSAVSCNKCGTVYFKAPSTSSGSGGKGFVSSVFGLRLILFSKVYQGRFNPQALVRPPEALPRFLRRGQPVNLAIRAPRERRHRNKVRRFPAADDLHGGVPAPPVHLGRGVGARG